MNMNIPNTSTKYFQKRNEEDNPGFDEMVQFIIERAPPIKLPWLPDEEEEDADNESDMELDSSAQVEDEDISDKETKYLCQKEDVISKKNVVPDYSHLYIYKKDMKKTGFTREQHFIAFSTDYKTVKLRKMQGNEKRSKKKKKRK